MIQRWVETIADRLAVMSWGSGRGGGGGGGGEVSGWRLVYSNIENASGGINNDDDDDDDEDVGRITRTTMHLKTSMALMVQ